MPIYSVQSKPMKRGAEKNLVIVFNVKPTKKDIELFFKIKQFLFHDIDWCFAESSYTFLDTQSYFHMFTSLLIQYSCCFLEVAGTTMSLPCNWHQFCPSGAGIGSSGRTFTTFSKKNFLLSIFIFFIWKVVKVPLMPIAAKQEEN